MSLPKIQTAYMTFSDFQLQPQSWKDSVLGVIDFGTSASDLASEHLAADATTTPIIHLQAAVLDGADIAIEIWLSLEDLSQDVALKSGQHGACQQDVSQQGASQPGAGQQGSIQYRMNDELLFGVISVPEKNSLQDATESAYREIFALMESLDYPHVYRFWNYMTDINGISEGLERYRQFNVGRKNAFSFYENGIGDQLPAACALGLSAGPLSIAFLLGRQAPIAIENPRQINAFEYPEDYGPRTPSFSRATLLPVEKNEILFISGTASIVGHLTQHSGDVIAQTRETLINLDAVIAEANRILGQEKFDLRDVYFRVYIRHKTDLNVVRNEMQMHIGGPVKALFVQADICRTELLLEIEATIGPMIAPMIALTTHQ